MIVNAGDFWKFQGIHPCFVDQRAVVSRLLNSRGKAWNNRILKKSNRTMNMEWLNYHHLLYFWTVAREGSVAAACERLGLAQPTVSAQIRTLEKSLGVELFDRTRRRMELTEIGKTVYRYADDIFALGREMLDTMQGRPTGRPTRFHVGIADVVPKLVAYRLLTPALDGDDDIQMICTEGKPDQLLAQLSIHELDVVLSDAPIGANVSIRGFNHLLGECTVTVFATPSLAQKYRRRFPHSTAEAPWLLPTSGTVLRRALDHWFDNQDISPRIVGEFEDSALKKVFGQEGVGLFAGPTVIEKEVCKQYGVRVVGRIDNIREQFYAISMERKIRHPSVLALTESARNEIFS
ncbi:MAG: transcriptional activator NhaR [Phycisphaerae bacterium]|nr:MAG: transcriptional activator NhaR [Phycisphaerae bacterium]